jgi:AraC-like DNA-binding protein
MVCNRCVLVIRNTLENLGYPSVLVSMGEVDFENQPLSKADIEQIEQAIEPLGFELIGDKKLAMIERIKTSLIELTNGDTVLDDFKLSDYVAAQLKQDYHSLSHLFSSVEGITIEKYFILLKVERIKELLVYDELSQSEIAWRLGYSSPAHLSAQFKQVTGMTPSAFKKLKDNKQRRPLDKI